jgi:hypothetical protein
MKCLRRQRSSRRQWLAGAGLGVGGLLLPSLLGDRAARAQAAPKRLVLLWTTHGPGYSWRMRRPGLPDLTADWEFPLDPDSSTWSSILRPLHPNRDKVLVLDGLGFDTVFVDSPGGGNGHALSQASIWDGSTQRQATLDQYIAEQIAVPGRFKYLYYSVGGTGSPGKPVDLAGNPVPATQLSGAKPAALQQALDRVFGAIGQAPRTTSGPLSPSELSRVRRPGVLAAVQSEYAALLPTLGAEDRAKLARHRDMIADLARQATALPQVQCAKLGPQTAAMTDTEMGGFVLSKLIPTAMACDLTRVAMVEFGEPLSEELGAPRGLDVHGDIAHQAKAGSQQDTWMASYYALRARQFNDMVNAFRSVPEGNGTMLDNSLLLWIPELGSGLHDLYRLMIVMAGGAAGAFKMGRYLKYAENGAQLDPYNNPTLRAGPGHNQLLASVMQAMGVNRSSIGTQGGKIWTGSTISMSGTLPRLAG